MNLQYNDECHSLRQALVFTAIMAQHALFYIPFNDFIPEARILPGIQVVNATIKLLVIWYVANTPQSIFFKDIL